MEKDYFSDRPEEVKYYNNINIGDLVYVCEKHMQKSAAKINDLTIIKVTEHLTSSAFHPRGQKVKGIDHQTGEIKVGRVIYITSNGKVITKNGLKYEYELK